MKNTQNKFSKHIKLHVLILVGYLALFLGSWATFMIGLLFLLPILIGIEYAVFALYKDEQINIKDVFKFMDKSSRSATLAHYTLLSFIYGILIALIPVTHNILLNLITKEASVNIVSSLLVTVVTILVYVSVQTVFSFSTIIKIDTNATTQQAISISKKMVFSKPLYFIGMRLLFFFRNIAIFLMLGLQLLSHFGITESPTSVSGDPAMLLFMGWFLLLVLSTPFYEKMMVKLYIANKDQIEQHYQSKITS